MAYVPIPLAALESPAYKAMLPECQKFLIDLYVLFHDCESFKINTKRPGDYRQTGGADLSKKIRGLLESGLLTISNMEQHRTWNSRRVFAFTYPSIDAYKEAA